MISINSEDLYHFKSLSHMKQFYALSVSVTSSDCWN